MNKLKILLATVLVVVSIPSYAESATPITVYRSPSCSCCGKWLEHLKQNNFVIKDILTEDMEAIKQQQGVSKEMASCHTALVNNYVIEGHVPAEDIKALLKTQPKVTGIAVPKMPIGTPGMEMGDRKEAYDVMSFDSKHNYQVFKHHAE